MRTYQRLYLSPHSCGKGILSPFAYIIIFLFVTEILHSHQPAKTFPVGHCDAGGRRSAVPMRVSLEGSDVADSTGLPSFSSPQERALISGIVALSQLVQTAVPISATPERVALLLLLGSVNALTCV